MTGQVSHAVARCRTAVAGWMRRRLGGELSHAVANCRTSGAGRSQSAVFREFRGCGGPSVALQCDTSATLSGLFTPLSSRVRYLFCLRGIKIPAWQRPRRVLEGGVRDKRLWRVYPSPPAPSTSLGFGGQFHMSQVIR